MAENVSLVNTRLGKYLIQAELGRGGMAIVYRIVSGYGGGIRVTSTPGAGTAVQVRLPVQAPLPAA